MPLSEHEQRILDEIERRLAAEDPKFARATAVATPRGVASRRLRRSVMVFVAGLVLLIAGLIKGLGNADVLVVLGLVGFVVMLSSVVLMVRAWKELGPPGSAAASSWVQRMEKRWRARNDDSDAS